MTKEKLDELWRSCDQDEGGDVDYEEFSTVMTKALFPQKAQSGVTTTGWTTDVLDMDQGYGQVASTRFGEATRVLNAKQGIKGKTGDLVGATSRMLVRLA